MPDFKGPQCTNIKAPRECDHQHRKRELMSLNRNVHVVLAGPKQWVPKFDDRCEQTDFEVYGKVHRIKHKCHLYGIGFMECETKSCFPCLSNLFINVEGNTVMHVDDVIVWGAKTAVIKSAMDQLNSCFICWSLEININKYAFWKCCNSVVSDHEKQPGQNVGQHKILGFLVNKGVVIVLSF